MILRDYQHAAVDSIFAYFENGGKGNPVVALPTGTGKSVVIGAFIKRAMSLYPSTRVMKLTHVKELIQQNLEKLLAVWPHAPAGVFSSGLGRKDIGYPIVFGGVASVAKSKPEVFGRIDLLLIDECHLLSPKDSTMYQVIISVLKEINPYLKVVGFTATHYRLGQGMLTEEGGLFTDVCFDMTRLDAFNWFLTEGYLARLVPQPTYSEFDLSGVHMSGGEYKQNELQAAVDQDQITHAACKELVAKGSARHHWLVFACGVEHAVHVAAMLDSMGVSTTFVHSKMSDGDRDSNIARFKAGEFKAMVNNGILTTGYDDPNIDLIGMLRATQSASLWVQMLGRGTRPVYMPGYDLTTAEGRLEAMANSWKQNCLVLDFAGNARRLGPINDPVLPKAKGKGPKGEAPIKLCEACGTYNHASVRFCEHCGAEFTREYKFKSKAGTDELIADRARGEELPVVEVFKVDRVTYAEHSKPGRPTSMQVSYYCGLRMFREWICFEHSGFPKHLAHEWWKERSWDEVPELTADAMTQVNELKQPTHIRVWINRQHPEVKAYDVTGSAFGQGA